MFFFIGVDGGGFSFFDFQNQEVGGKNVNESHDEAYPCNNYSTETVLAPIVNSAEDYWR